ncbi:hypothetical protein BBF96_06215 [Anoxybacter fermentans]|uniref:Tail specific protease domain-containing protein n=1 Tax=Anoxybacter fermentans TaxID=1323375 RepID=A0A3Q9HRQ4_9FIRM|nr:S41 family peptidase [Anoxybacter fermentans]AZR73027.1 hypothetical protein BBF96_06215 [Anoxybacter fermentans]
MKRKWLSKHSFKILLFILLLLVINITSVIAQEGEEESEKLLPPEKLQEDLNFIISTLRDVHPALNEGPLLNAFNERAKAALAHINHPMTRFDFYLLAGDLVNSLKDAHTLLWIKSNRRLPLMFRWVNDGIVIVGKPGLPIQKGDQLIRLGGLAPEELLEKLRILIPAENDFWIKRMGERYLISDFFLKSFKLLTPDETVKLTLKHANGEIYTIELPLKTTQAKLNYKPKRHWFGWKLNTEYGYGLFWLDKCENTPEYKKAVDEFFTAVKESGIKRIAIDVRYNSGGNSRVINAFLKYLPAKTIHEFRSEIRFSPQAIEKRGYSKLFPLFRAIYKLLWNNKSNTPRPSDPNLIFNGKVFVLTSWQTFSSGNWIAVLLKDNKLATIVGEPTGNAPSSFGDILIFETPNLQLKFSVSHKYFARPNPKADFANTLKPDVFIPTTINDIRKGRDPQLEWLVNFATEKDNQ